MFKKGGEMKLTIEIHDLTIAEIIAYTHSQKYPKKIDSLISDALFEFMEKRKVIGCKPVLKKGERGRE